LEGLGGVTHRTEGVGPKEHGTGEGILSGTNPVGGFVQRRGQTGNFAANWKCS